MPFMEPLLCGVTKGKLLLPVYFPPCWCFLEGRVCWVRPRLVWEYSKGENNEVSLKSPATGEEQARPAACWCPGKEMHEARALPGAFGR